MRTPKHEIKEQGINLPIYHLIISVIPACLESLQQILDKPE